MPNKSGKISSAGRGPLIWSEREALRVQHGNRAAVGRLPADEDRDRLARIKADTAMKAPRLIKDPRPLFERKPIKPSEAY